LLQVVAAGGILSILFLAWPDGYTLLLALYVFLVLLVILDWLITPSPKVLSAERLVASRLSLLHLQTVQIIIRNQSRTRLQVRWRDTTPLSFDVEAPASSVGTRLLPCLGTLTGEYAIQPRKRGQYFFGDLHLRYLSLFGFWERSTVRPMAAEVRVYPSVAGLERYHLLARANRLDLLGVRLLRLKGAAEFESLREYQRGDDVRLLDWKATARRSKLIVRNQQAERNQTILVLLDCGRLMNAEENGVSKLDLAINATLLLAHVALSRGDRIGLCAFSHRPHVWVSPRSSLHQLQLISDAMYNLQGDYTESNHGRVLESVASRYNKRALLILLTDFVDAATSIEMLTHLRQSTRRHLILFAALKDRYLIQASRQHVATVSEGFQQSTAVELLQERRLVLEQLRRHGLQVIDAAPEDLAPSLLNKYLEITHRGLL
jgi:uncharacterized protein (DUF58 family)